MLVRPDDSVNGGSFRSLSVSAPKDTIFHATEPAACAWYFSSLGLLIDLVVKALAPQLRTRSAGAHYGDSMVVTIAGGWGGFDGCDGANSLINNVNGNFKDLPVEIFENKYPISIQSYGIRADSGGIGKYRGGNGTFRRYLLQADANLSLWFERSVSPAWGLFGGKAGLGPKVVIEEPGREPVSVLKINSAPLTKGTVITTYTRGGGGYGPVADRDYKAVEADIADGLVTRKWACAAYQLAAKPDADTDTAR